MEKIYEINKSKLVSAKHLVMIRSGLVEAQNLKINDILISSVGELKI